MGDALNVDLRDGLAASATVAPSAEGAGAPPTEPATEPAAAAAPEAAVPVTDPASSAEAAPAPTQDAAPPAAEGSGEPPADTSAPEPEAPAFDWEAWDGDIDKAPEDAQPALKAYATRVAVETKALLAEKDELITRYDDFIRNNVGEDPKLLEKSKELEKLEADYKAFQEKYQTFEQEQSGKLSELQAQLEQAQEAAISTSHKHILRFLRSREDLTGTDARKAKTMELLRDPDYEWDVYDFPALVPLPKPQFDKVRELVVSGKVSEVKLAVQLVTGGEKPKPKSTKASPDAVGATKRQPPTKPEPKDPHAGKPFADRFQARKKSIASAVAQELGFKG